MKIKLYLLSFLFSFVLLSCKEDESQQAQIHISKVANTNSLYPNSDYISNFSYTSEGLINEYVETNNGGIPRKYAHFYEGNRIHTLDVMDQSNGNSKQIFNYDKTGRLSSATVTSQSGKHPPSYLTFLYDENGRVVRVNSTVDPAQAGIAFILEYDKTGNIIWERRHNTSPTGELYQPFSVIKISYDNKKNPLHRFGSPWIIYGYTLTDVSRLITFFSINNPTGVEVYDQRGEKIRSLTFDYEYNREGFPSKITQGYSTLQLNYSIK